MKNTFWVLALGAAFAASATMAKADTITSGSEISVNISNSMFNTSNQSAGTMTFAPNGTCSTCGNYTVGGSSGTFALYFHSPNPVTFFPNAPSGAFPLTLPLGAAGVMNTPGPPLLVLTTTENNETLDFYLTSETWNSSQQAGYTDLAMTGFGYFTLTGSNGAPSYTVENASFNFTAQQPIGGVMDPVSFSATGTAISPVPEPSSLALLGTGLLGAAAFARRKLSARFSA